jgi:hypothetical protein
VTSDYYADKDDPTVAHDLQRANDLEAPQAT